MKKVDRYREILLQKKRERKRLKRSNKSFRFAGTHDVASKSTVEKQERFLQAIDNRIIKSFKSPLREFFVSKKFLLGSEDTNAIVSITGDFSFCNNYETAIEKIRDFVASIFTNIGKEIILDFSECTSTDQPVLFVLQILRIEFQTELNKLDKRLKILSAKTFIRVKPSKDESVNKLLFVTGLIPQVELKTKGLMPLTTIGYHKGSKSQKHYSENRKGAIGTNITRYINHCLSFHGYMFTPEGINYLEGIVTEALNNAEDHSPFNTYYATANLLGEIKTDEDMNVVGEMNLSFLNFGFSFYEGFEENKAENHEVYEQMEKLYKQVDKGIFKPFSKAALFTLYALQDGMSRLKFQETSRGNGSMKFINSFFSFGDYEDEEKHYHPNLTILTGETQLICDNRFKPFERDGVFFVSLNAEKTLAVLPEKSNLKELKHCFPGTLLTARIYLNSEHLRKKVVKNETNKN